MQTRVVNATKQQQKTQKTITCSIWREDVPVKFPILKMHLKSCLPLSSVSVSWYWSY